MAATGEDSLATEIKVIEKNPEWSQGKSMISERDNTAEDISEPISCDVAQYDSQNTLKNLEHTAASSQTLNTS